MTFGPAAEAPLASSARYLTRPFSSVKYAQKPPSLPGPSAIPWGGSEAVVALGATSSLSKVFWLQGGFEHAAETSVYAVTTASPAIATSTGAIQAMPRTVPGVLRELV